ncbi:MAG: hypothetical protein ACNA8W_06260 [Bradymonadaceae bacterium]
MNPALLLKQRFGGSWDGEAPEIHGLIEIGPRSLKIELLWVKATNKWQCCVFEGGTCLIIASAEDFVEGVAAAVSQAL